MAVPSGISSSSRSRRADFGRCLRAKYVDGDSSSARHTGSLRHARYSQASGPSPRQMTSTRPSNPAQSIKRATSAGYSAMPTSSGPICTGRPGPAGPRSTAQTITDGVVLFPPECV